MVDLAPPQIVTLPLGQCYDLGRCWVNDKWTEAACATSDERLFAQCRRYVAEHAGAVRKSGGVEQLRDFGVAKGLLADSMDLCTELKAAVEKQKATIVGLRAGGAAQ